VPRLQALMQAERCDVGFPPSHCQESVIHFADAARCLKEIGVNPCLHTLKQGFVRAMDGQDEDLGCRGVPPDHAHHLQPVEGRELWVENDQIRLMLTNELDQAESVGCSCHHSDNRKEVEYVGEHLCEQRLLVSNYGA